MPFKPKRPCSQTGCPKLTDGRFCEEHAKEEAKRYERCQRDPAMKKRYNRTWKRIRDRYIKEYSLCGRCQKAGKFIPSEEVHHIIPLSRGGTNDTENPTALCSSCHSQITARGGGWDRKNQVN